MYFTDIHCHMLPDTDDGAKDKMQAAEMLRIAWQEGIRTICVTPHYRPHRFPVDEAVLKDRLDWLRQMAARIDKSIRIVRGNELYYSESGLEDLESGKCRTLNGSRYVLVEFSPAAGRGAITGGLSRILSCGFEPVLAHVERYESVMQDWRYVEELRRQGAVIQVNAQTVMGDYGLKAKRGVKKLLKKQLVDVIATDAHSSGRRSPRLKECGEFLEKKFGKDYAEALLLKNPDKILRNEILGGP